MSEIKVIKIDALPSMTMAVSPDLFELLRNNSSAHNVMMMTQQMLKEIKEHGNTPPQREAHPVYPPGHFQSDGDEAGMGEDGGVYGLRRGPLVSPDK